MFRQQRAKTGDATKTVDAWCNSASKKADFDNNADVYSTGNEHGPRGHGAFRQPGTDRNAGASARAVVSSPRLSARIRTDSRRRRR
jgi:hypothetical protein